MVILLHWKCFTYNLWCRSIVTTKPQVTKGKPIRGTVKQPQKFNPASNPGVYGRCGKSGCVGKQQCPAKDAICQKCYKCGHFHNVCRTKSIRAMSTEDSEEEFFVGMIEDPGPSVVPTVSSGTNPWTVKVLLNDHQMELHCC